MSSSTQGQIDIPAVNFIRAPALLHRPFHATPVISPLSCASAVLPDA
jgi:hypothetical protein